MVISKRNQEGGVKHKLREKNLGIWEQSTGVRKVVECFKCKKVGHRAKECTETECYKCGRNGLIKRNCTSKEEKKMQGWKKKYGKERGTEKFWF